MRRPRRRLEVSTFPFLAVLLCAMGSLILLLLVLDRRAKAAARAKAEQSAQVALAERDAATRAAFEAAAQRAAERAAERERRRQAQHDQLAQARDEVAGQLRSVEEQRTATGRAAGSQRNRWRELLEVLGNQREELAKAERETAAGRGTAAETRQATEAASKEAMRLSAQLRGLELVLAELKEARRREAQTYSLLPYRGRRGDGRRPLYIECTANGVVFHPDRKMFARIATVSELRGEVEARVQRQRDAVRARGGEPDKRPYLLMLVRPDGIPSYYGTVAAMQGKEIDFGYEFIDADWVLDFPEDDTAPGTQPWMTARRTPAAPIDPSAPTRKVAGTHPGAATGGARRMSEGDSIDVARGAALTMDRGGSSDLPPLPGAAGGGYGVGPSAGGSGGSADLPPLPGGTGGSWRASGGPGAGSPDSDGRMPGQPQAPPGAPAGSGQAMGPQAGSRTAGGPPALFPWDKGSPPGTAGGGPSTGTATNGSPTPAVTAAGGAGGSGQPAGTPASPQPTTAQSAGAVGGGPGAGAKTNPGGAVPQDPDEPQAPRLDAGRLTGGERPAPPPPRTIRLIGNRDWVIPVECRADGVVIRGAGQKLPLTALAAGTTGESPLLQAVNAIIARRQASVRPGEPPYRPQVRFLIYPDALRTYYAAFPALQPLGIPLTRQNVEADAPARPRRKEVPT